MPRNCILGVEASLPGRAGALYELRATRDLISRLDDELWQFSRLPFRHTMPISIGGRAGITKLGQQLQQALAAGELTIYDPDTGAPSTAPWNEQIATIEALAHPSATAALPPIARTSGAAAARAPAVPDQLSYALSISNQVATFGDYLAVSTDPLPWPCRITQCSMTMLAGPDNYLQWNICTSFTDQDGEITALPGAPLITSRFSLGGAGAQDESLVDLGPRATLGFEIMNNAALASSAIGALIAAAGLRLVFVIKPTAAITTTTAQLLVTVESLTAGVSPGAVLRALTPTPPPAPRAPAAAARAPTTAIPRVTAAPRAPAVKISPPATAPAAAPAPRVLADIGQVSTAGQAGEVAAYLKGTGNDAQAATYADMQKRMAAGQALTPAQEGLLNPWAQYRPTTFGRTAGLPLAVLG